METRFTPGPWHPVEYAGFWNIRTQPFYDDGVDVNNADDVGYVQSTINAFLCAAAPDLLEALNFIICNIEHDNDHPGYYWINEDALTRAKCAIKKATEF